MNTHRPIIADVPALERQIQRLEFELRLTRKELEQLQDHYHRLLAVLAALEAIEPQHAEVLALWPGAASGALQEA
ncbi:MAG: hypothetical protein QN122_13565 [Armatimonadota bacterium]|nr:hypothetical protein [Armatimonadota bacterium]